MWHFVLYSNIVIAITIIVITCIFKKEHKWDYTVHA